jgi:large exoprotein involved in heme utilization and adhesion
VAGIGEGLGSVNAKAGDVVINTTESVTLDSSSIANFVVSSAVGNGGELNITTSDLVLTNGSVISTSTLGTGNAGNITINATDISADGGNNIGSKSGLFSTVEAGAIGNSNEIKITTNSLSLTNGGQVNATTLGKGNAGNIIIDATDISADGVGSSGFPSAIASTVETVQNTGAVNAGDINITAEKLSLTNGGVVNGSTFGQGNAGNIIIDATDVSADGVGSNGFASAIASTVGETGVGDAGDINITAEELSLTDGGVVNGSIFGQGNAGLVTIEAGNIFANGVGSNGFASAIASTVGETGVGDAGGIEITTSELSLTNGGAVNSNTLGQGNAGLVTIEADNISATILMLVLMSLVLTVLLTSILPTLILFKGRQNYPAM